jgi:hypothetical protein
MALFSTDYAMLRLLKFSPFERRGDRWRFGARTIGDSVVARLIASGRAELVGETVTLIQRGDAQ